MGDHVIVRCHCGQLKEEVQLRDKIPVKGTMCHCNICRHVTGAMTFTGLAIASASAEVFREKLTKFATSNKIWRYSCTICGSQPVYYVVEEDRWSACAGAIDEVHSGKEGELEDITGHEFVGDTIDGGLSLAMPDVPYYLNADNEPPIADVSQELARLLAESSTQNPDTLEAMCHCGNVNFTIGRPDDGSKWSAGVCVCRSCRLSLSQTLVAWACNIPWDKITWSDGTKYDGSALHPSLRTYLSSDCATRAFCNKCFASVLFNSTEQPRQADIAFGILRAREGSLARTRFEWRSNKVEFIEDAIDQKVATKVQENLTALNSA